LLKQLGYVSSKRAGPRPTVFTLHPAKMPDLTPEMQFKSEASTPEAHFNLDLKSTSLTPEIHFSRNKEEPVLTGKSNRKPITPLLIDVQSLPDWLPLDSWNGLVEMRRKMRKPLTPRAIVLILKKLEAFRAEGQDPAAVLDQSIEKGWTSVFTHSSSPGGSRPDLSERNRLACERWEREHKDEIA
jgi:hypothetical protein